MPVPPLHVPVLPAQQVAPNVWLKRDDLHRPFSDCELNGAKTYQCLTLIGNNRDVIASRHHSTVFSDNFSHSPQAPIVARCAREFGFKCIIPVAAHGTGDDVVRDHAPMAWARSFGAEIAPVCKMGFALRPRARKLYGPEGHDFFHVSFGMNVTTPELRACVVNPVRLQAQAFLGLPTEEMTLVVPTGSAVVFSGLLLGLHDYGIRFKRVVSVQIAGYDRSARVREIVEAEGLSYGDGGTMDMFGDAPEVHPHEIVVDGTHDYNTLLKREVGGVILDSQYEAKAWDWVERSGMLDAKDGPVMFYVVGNSDCVRDREMAFT